MEKDDSAKLTYLKYRKHSIIVLGAIALYMAASLYLVGKPHLSNWFTMCFTGKPSLQVATNQVIVTPQTVVKKVGLLLDRPVIADIVAGKDKPAYEIKMKQQTKMVVITSRDKEGAQEPFSIQLKDKDANALFNPFFIREIDVDESRPNVVQATEKFITFGDKVTTYYPFHVHNISGTLAQYAKLPLYTIVFILLMLFLTQVVYIISVNKLPKELANAILDEQDDKQVSTVDKLTGLYAIPLGFLGTIMSLWITLENTGSDLYDFRFFIETLKIALLTSVLGLGSKLLLVLRAHISLVFK